MYMSDILLDQINKRSWFFFSFFFFLATERGREELQMEKDKFGDIMTQILSESHPYSMDLLFSLTHKIIHIFTG